MYGPNRFDDINTDHHRFEARQVARDRDRTRPSTADVGERAAREVVESLLTEETVTAVPDQRLYVHWPSGRRFKSRQQLAVFHQGWTAARELNEEER